MQAIERLEKGESYFACNALRNVCATDAEIEFFREVFGHPNDSYMSGWYGPGTEENVTARILALALASMAAEGSL